MSAGLASGGSETLFPASLLASSGLLAVSGVPWLTDVSGRYLPECEQGILPMHVSPSFPTLWQQSSWSRGPFYTNMTSSQLIISATTWAYSKIWVLGILHKNFGEDAIQHTTLALSLPKAFLCFSFTNNFYYLRIFGCAGSLLLGRLLSSVGAPASHCSGISCSRAQAPELRLSSGNTPA